MVFHSNIISKQSASLRFIVHTANALLAALSDSYHINLG